MRPAHLLAASAIGLLLAGAIAPAAWAQAAAPDPHHPAGTPDAASPQPMVPAPEAGVAAPAPPGAMPGGMGMMGGDMGMMHRMMQGMMAGGGMAMGDGPVDPVEGAFAAVNRRMHRDMTIRSTGNPDADFAAAMIPHHQGAIDMAKVQLGFGKDPELRRLAEEIVAAQEKEIAFLRQWLARQAN